MFPLRVYQLVWTTPMQYSIMQQSLAALMLVIRVTAIFSRQNPPTPNWISCAMSLDTPFLYADSPVMPANPTGFGSDTNTYMLSPS